MGMTPEEFFIDFVLGNYVDFKSDPGSIRKAFNAAISTSHFADHYFEYYKRHDHSKLKSYRGIGDFINHISKSTNDNFRHIRSISNVYKHLYSDKEHSSISSTGAIESICFADKNREIQIIEKDWFKGYKTNDSYPKVVFICKDGQKRDFITTLKSVIEFWEKLLMG